MSGFGRETDIRALDGSRVRWHPGTVVRARALRVLIGGHALAGEGVGALVAGVAGVALDPAPLDLVVEWPAWPLTQRHSTSWSASAASRRRHRSTFLTGFLAEVFQPFAFQR